MSAINHVYFTFTGDDTVHSLELFQDVIDLGSEHVKHIVGNHFHAPADAITIVEKPGHEATLVRKMGCSNCGSTAPHHVAYVAEHGVCVS